jgi:hypothetical protein
VCGWWLEKWSKILNFLGLCVFFAGFGVLFCAFLNVEKVKVNQLERREKGLKQFLQTAHLFII